MYIHTIQTVCRNCIIFNMKSGYLKWCKRVPQLTLTRLRQSNVIKQGRITKWKLDRMNYSMVGKEISGLGTKIKGKIQQDK